MIFSIRKPQEKEIDAVEWNRRIREDAPRQTVELMADFFDLKWASLADFWWCPFLPPWQKSIRDRKLLDWSRDRGRRYSILSGLICFNFIFSFTGASIKTAPSNLSEDVLELV